MKTKLKITNNFVSPKGDEAYINCIPNIENELVKFYKLEKKRVDFLNDGKNTLYSIEKNQTNFFFV